MKASISRKKFLKKTGLLLCVPALFTFNTACDNNNIANSPSTNSFDQIFSKKQTFIANSLAKTKNNLEAIYLPKATIYLNKIPGDQFVLRRTVVSNKVYFQVVEIKIIESNDTNVFVQGIILGDELVLNPRAVLRDMAKTDVEETKKRVLHIQKWQGGK